MTFAVLLFSWHSPLLISKSILLYLRLTWSANCLTDCKLKLFRAYTFATPLVTPDSRICFKALSPVSTSLQAEMNLYFYFTIKIVRWKLFFRLSHQLLIRTSMLHWSNFWTMCTPIPREPPVTIATLFDLSGRSAMEYISFIFHGNLLWIQLLGTKIVLHLLSDSNSLRSYSSGQNNFYISYHFFKQNNELWHCRLYVIAYWEISPIITKCNANLPCKQLMAFRELVRTLGVQQSIW